MPNPFKSIGELFLSVLEGHIDAAKIDRILSNQQQILDNQQLIKRALSTTAGDILSIKAFLGVPDARIVASQEDLDQLGARLQRETAATQEFDNSLNATTRPTIVSEAPPAPQ